MNNDICTKNYGVYLQWNVASMRIIRFKTQDVQNVWNNWDNPDVDE